MKNILGSNLNRFIVLAVLPALSLISCAKNNEDTEMKLTIDNRELDVTWLDSESVNALKQILPFSIKMHKYGGFEQTGSIGKTIVSNDRDIDVVPGDIVLYDSSAISVFYNESSWSYTSLGHINLTHEELISLLDKAAITFELK